MKDSKIDRQKKKVDRWKEIVINRSNDRQIIRQIERKRGIQIDKRETDISKKKG